MKTTLIHDWLLSPIGGSENTLHEIYSLFPAPIYTLLFNRETFAESPLSNAEITTSFLQKLPGWRSHFRLYLPFFPFAIQQFDLSSYDLILSSSHCVAHGVQTSPRQTHICYCHTPMRYAWDLSTQYLSQTKWAKPIAKWLLARLRKWDQHASKQVTHYVANSHFVAQRIRTYYGRNSTVIYPPVNTSFFSATSTKDNYYIAYSRLVPYKKIDLIVKAFAQMPDLKLVVIGDGPDAHKIRQSARKNIEFLGFQPHAVLRQYLRSAKALLFAAIEDFGIAPIEAMACGTPVIALKKGGAAETVLDHTTGLFFEEQTVPSIQQAVREFEKKQHLFDPCAIEAHARQFSADRFRKEFREYVNRVV